MKGDKPTLIAYSVKDPPGAEQKAIWTRIGAAWPARERRRLFDPPGRAARRWPDRAGGVSRDEAERAVVNASSD